MARAYIKLSQSVDATSTATSSYTPANGKVFDVIAMRSSCASSLLSYAKLEWNSTLIWATWGTGEYIDRTDQYTGDGIKVLTLTLVNGEAAAKIMSGEVEYYEY